MSQFPAQDSMEKRLRERGLIRDGEDLWAYIKRYRRELQMARQSFRYRFAEWFYMLPSPTLRFRDVIRYDAPEWWL